MPRPARFSLLRKSSLLWLLFIMLVALLGQLRTVQMFQIFKAVHDLNPRHLWPWFWQRVPHRWQNTSWISCRERNPYNGPISLAKQSIRREREVMKIRKQQRWLVHKGFFARFCFHLILTFQYKNNLTVRRVSEPHMFLFQPQLLHQCFRTEKVKIKRKILQCIWTE